MASAQADNAKTMLLRTMSHELKTPLNAILGFSELMSTLADNLTAAQIREYAGLVHQGGSNLLKMLNQIMDLTKISAGRYDLQKLPAGCGRDAVAGTREFRRPAKAKDITINADACPIGLMAMADESVLTGMLNALIDNAVTFTQKGGRIELAAVQDGRCAPVDQRQWPSASRRRILNRILQPFRACRPRRGPCQGRRPWPDPGQGLCGTAWRPARSRKPAPAKVFTAVLTLPAA